MRFSSPLACGVFLLSGMFSSYAQTAPVAQDSAVIKSISVTTDSVHTTRTISRAVSDTGCVYKLPKIKEFNSWEVGLHGGLAYPNTDIAASDVNAHNFKALYGVDVSVAKYFSHSLGLQAQFMTGKLEGFDNVERYGFHTTIKYDMSLNAIIQSGGVTFVDNPTNLSFFLTAGVGFINFNPVNDSNGVTVPYNYHITATGLVEHVNYSNTTEIIIPFGVGFHYLFSPKFSVDGEYSLRVMRSDKLDGWYRVLSEDDNYSYVSVGFTYHIGKKAKSIEWMNPVQDLLSRICAMEEKIDSYYSKKDSFALLLKDTDHDGVPDLFDKDNSTPPGVKVYGDGTAVDFDRDGVPDYLDECPTIPGLAKFNGCPDTDGDGVPDQQDSCPLVPGPASNHGCPLAVEKIVPAKTEPVKATLTADEQDIIAKVYRNLEFETGKSVIRESSFPSLDDLAGLLKRKPQFKVLIEGHTDNVGGAAFNMNLSTKRAEAVKKYLTDKGTDASQTMAKGYGMTKPLVPNTTAAGRQKNRRVEFTILEQ